MSWHYYYYYYYYYYGYYWFVVIFINIFPSVSTSRFCLNYDWHFYCWRPLSGDFQVIMETANTDIWDPITLTVIFIIFRERTFAVSQNISNVGLIKIFSRKSWRRRYVLLIRNDWPRTPRRPIGEFTEVINIRHGSDRH